MKKRLVICYKPEKPLVLEALIGHRHLEWGYQEGLDEDKDIPRRNEELIVRTLNTVLANQYVIFQHVGKTPDELGPRRSWLRRLCSSLWALFFRSGDSD